VDSRALVLLRELAADGAATVSVRGACMEPRVRDESRVSVRARRVYWPGDVIVFRAHNEQLTAHRVLGWRPAGIVTKGGGCDVHDAPIGPERVIGIVDVRITMRERLAAIAAFARIAIRRAFR
jgi:hypothetical protein